MLCRDRGPHSRDSLSHLGLCPRLRYNQRMPIELPRVATVKQQFPRPQLESLEEYVTQKLRESSFISTRMEGCSIAIAVGSRGIAGLDRIVRCTVKVLRGLGAEPFIVPAMGSHGGATSKGQAQILLDYGINEDIGARIVSSLDCVHIGSTADGVSVQIDKAAFESDGIILINRIKPHTDFHGEIGSGLLKMMAVGLGNADGAREFHTWVGRLKHEHLLRTRAKLVLDTGKILFGLGVIENAYHETAAVELVEASQILDNEPVLLKQAAELMPSLPVTDLDLLIIDKIGKNISGTGMDPNITGRWFELSSIWQESPYVTRIVVLDLDEGSHGNALGIGLADFCSSSVVEKMDSKITYTNAVVSRNTATARIPITFATDRETIEQAALSLGNGFPARDIRLIRIQDTLSLASIVASESLVEELGTNPQVSSVARPGEMIFDLEGKLLPIRTH